MIDGALPATFTTTQARAAGVGPRAMGAKTLVTTALDVATAR